MKTRSLRACGLSVPLELPCGLSAGHDGVCQPDHEETLRIYGLTLGDVERIQRDLADARRLGLDLRPASITEADTARPALQPSTARRYVQLYAAVKYVLDTSPGTPDSVKGYLRRALEGERPADTTAALW